MRIRLEQALRRLGTSPGDALAAVALTVLALGDVNARTTLEPVPTTVATAAVVLGLAWRLRQPAVVAIALSLLQLVLSATAPGPFPPQLVLPAVLLGLYTAAAHLAGRAAVVTGAVTLVVLAVAHAVTVDGDPGDFLPWLVWAAPWTAGRLVRRRTLEAARVATEGALRAAAAEAESREAVDRERDRIARELHDVIAHSVSLMVVQAGAERLLLDPTASRTRTALESIEATGRQALTELRTMLAVLRSDEPEAEPTLAPQPDLDRLDDLAGRVRAAGMTVDVEVGDLSRVPPAVSRSGYRIVQEALTNALKHGSGQVSVRLAVDDDDLRVVVRSPLDGVPSQRPGRGLVGMHERALLHGGRVQAGPRSSEWVVEAVLPLDVRLPA